ncbi:hypothetical protein GJ496_007376 [Pomphorhynchus laevis]|nr:hypothetical protein GJ496_007376 [Pomphorhynchus laevis]
MKEADQLLSELKRQELSADRIEQELEKYKALLNKIEQTVSIEKENEKLRYRLNILLTNVNHNTDDRAVELHSVLKQIFDDAIISSAQCNWTELIQDISSLPSASIQRYKQHIRRNGSLKSNTSTVANSDHLSISENMFDFQCNSAFQIAPMIKQKVNVVAEQIADCLPKNNIIDRILCSSGFVSFSISRQYVNRQVQNQLRSVHKSGKILDCPISEHKRLKVIIDYSSPNIAKEMHVGHLRSSIIGESISRLMRYVGHEVLPLNHLGDWGTQFGMLITHIQDKYPDYLQNPPPLSDLVCLYKAAKIRFDEDAGFKRRSLDTVVRLQNRETREIEAWKLLCHVSQQSFKQIYKDLDINLIDRGESFYQDMMPHVIKELEEKGLVVESEGCKVLHVDESSLPPLILQKSDGGYTYDTSDMAAIRHRIIVEQADCILYVVDHGQSLHLSTIFKAAKMAGWYDPNKHWVQHVEFGLVLGENGKKFKTRSGETVCLTDLLQSGIEKSKNKLIEKNRHLELTEDELSAAEKAVAYGCIKYADLSHNRVKDYVFSFDRMLDDRGNTAVYLLYNYTRIQSVLRKCSQHYDRDEYIRYCQSSEFSCCYHPLEMSLAKQLILYPDVIRRASEDLCIHSICEYIFEVATTFTDFYDQLYCLNKDSENKTYVVMHRIVLCELAAAVFSLCFHILGIQPLSKM